MENNKSETIVLIGVNHAGTSFARTLKRLNPHANLIAFDRNVDISFLGCGIALWVGGEFQDPNGLFYATPKMLENDYGINLKMEHDVIKIDDDKKVVVVKNLKTNEVFEQKFDKLVFAGGTWPIMIPVPGHDLKNILFSKIFAHAKVIHDKNNDPSIKDVVVLGAGYIGVELVEAFKKANKNVTLIDMADRVINRYFDKEFTTPLEEEMSKSGVNFRSGEKLKEFQGDSEGKVNYVVTDKGKYKADIVIVSIGFKPQTEMLKNKVDMLPNGAIIVNQFQQSSNKDIYAIGDSAAIKHSVLGQAHVALATNAVKTGLVAGFHLAGNDNIKFPGVNGTNAISVFGYNYSSTGISETSAKMLNIPVASSFLVDKDKPEFMRSAKDVMFKITYDPKTLKLIGAQIGSKDTNHTEVMYALSLAISKGMTLPEIALMDVFFLPHFNKPFNFMIQAILNAINLKY